MRIDLVTRGVWRSEVLLDVFQLDELVHDRIDRQTTGAVDLELLRDVASVGDDGVGREIELPRDLLVRHALDDADDDLSFAWREGL